MSTWFGHIAMVPQAPRALQGTIAENVRYLRDGISDEEVISALKTAVPLDDELISLPGRTRYRRGRVRRPTLR